MGKDTQKGRYICKVGFYDVYAKDSMKKAFQVRRPLGNAERLFVKQWVFTLLSFAEKGNGFFLHRSRRRVVWGGPWSSDTRRHARGLFLRPSRPSARHFP